MRISNTRHSLAAAIAVIALAVPAISSANFAKDDEKRSIKVEYSDLNIHSKAGAKVLYKRLQSATKELCDVRPLREIGNLHRRRIVLDCYEAALSKAVDNIDSAALKTLHQG